MIIFTYSVQIQGNFNVFFWIRIIDFLLNLLPCNYAIFLDRFFY